MFKIMAHNTKEIQCSIDNINIELYRLREMTYDSIDFPEDFEINIDKMDDILQELNNNINFYEYHNVNSTSIYEDLEE